MPVSPPIRRDTVRQAATSSPTRRSLRAVVDDESPRVLPAAVRQSAPFCSSLFQAFPRMMSASAAPVTCQRLAPGGLWARPGAEPKISSCRRCRGVTHKRDSVRCFTGFQSLNSAWFQESGQLRCISVRAGGFSAGGFTWWNHHMGVSIGA